MRPHVSLIIPVHNAEPFLERCLDSAAAQTEPELEIICVDDASTDASGTMLEERAKRDRRFRVVHRAVNGGESAARNEGIALARGEYLAFLDHDDMLEPDACRLLYQAAKAKNADIAKGRAKIVTYDGKTIGDSLQRHSDIATLSKFCFVCHWWTAIYKTQLANNIKFDERYRIGGDGLFLNDILINTHIVALKNDFVYKHFQLKMSNGSYILEADKVYQYVNVWKLIIDHLHKNKIYIYDKYGYIYKIADLFFSCVKVFDKAVDIKARYDIIRCMVYIINNAYHNSLFIGKISKILPIASINLLKQNDIDKFYKITEKGSSLLKMSILNYVRNGLKKIAKA